MNLPAPVTPGPDPAAIVQVRIDDHEAMQLALRLARRGYGRTSPNPMVGAVLVRDGRILGRGWHHRAGAPHAEIEALRDAARRGESPRGATLYVTLEPCCTHGRTPPCTTAIVEAGIARVVVAATDPNPRHAGRGYRLLRKAGLQVEHGLLADAATPLNEAFNHWIVHGTPFVTVKAAMSLDGKIATVGGESKWLTAVPARAKAMDLRRSVDAILVGVNTVIADDPQLLVRKRVRAAGPGAARPGAGDFSAAPVDRRRLLRRIVLDALARTPPTARVVADEFANRTTVFVGPNAPAKRVESLAKRVQVVRVSSSRGRLNLRQVLKRLGREGVTHLLVEGGGEVQGAFLEGRRAQRILFFYAPLVVGGAVARKAVAAEGFASWKTIGQLGEVSWRKIGPDLCLSARLQ